MQTYLSSALGLFHRTCVEGSIGGPRVKAFVLPRASSAPADRAHPQLNDLKCAMLRALLVAVRDERVVKQLCGAANQAAALAWSTAHPLLTFPCLFEEMAARIQERFAAWEELQEQPPAEPASQQDVPVAPAFFSSAPAAPLATPLAA